MHALNRIANQVLRGAVVGCLAPSVKLPSLLADAPSKAGGGDFIALEETLCASLAFRFKVETVHTVIALRLAGVAVCDCQGSFVEHGDVPFLLYGRGAEV